MSYLGLSSSPDRRLSKSRYCRQFRCDGKDSVIGGSLRDRERLGLYDEYCDNSTGLQHLRVRYYDPATVIFLGRNPLASGPGCRLGGR